MGERGTGIAPWSIFGKNGVAHLDVYIAGKRCRPSLGISYRPQPRSARDERAHDEAARRAYDRLVAGRVLGQGGYQERVLTSETLHELCAQWLVQAKKTSRTSDGFKTRVTQINNVQRWAEGLTATDEPNPRFADDKRPPIERLCDDTGPANFIADRITEVVRGTVGHELSNVFAFLEWARLEKKIAAIPPRPKLPKSAGVRVGPQRANPVDVSEEEALAVIAALPLFARKGGRGNNAERSATNIVCRDRFALAWELALRPCTVEKLSTPEHYTIGRTVRGVPCVWISEDIDKIGFAREIPLTTLALEILERNVPKGHVGPIFGEHDLRVQYKKAAAAVLSPEKAKDFSPYDLRHGRAVHVLEVTGNDLLGTQRMLGHKNATTMNRYLRTREAHLASVMGQLDAASAKTRAKAKKPAKRSSRKAA